MTATSLEVRIQSPKVDIRDLNLRYDKFHTLKNISLRVPERQVTASIGPSSCSESTLLRIFSRVYALYPKQRAGGQINMNDENLLTSHMDIALLRTKVGTVFQKPTPFLMSICDNIAFGVKLLKRLSRSEMDDHVEWVLTKAALWNEVKDEPNQSGYGLSGGQQRRLYTARGIAIRPGVLLLDEPCSAPDPISTGKIEELIAELKDDYTAVIVTYNMRQAARYSGYTAYMYLGELVRLSDTEKIFIRP